ncbi:MAG: FAD-dependent oxidoreductase [Pseudomonadota bacterium]
MIRETDVLIIGGGIAGLMTAWYLARDGVEVTLVEARDFGTQASGANAGSLHLQIQYPEFAAYGEDWGTAYAPTLRMLKASIAMWQALPQEVGEDLDVAVKGGLVVAQSDAQMRLIEAKARIEASVGVETEILTADALRTRAPYLSDAAIGGGFCAMEGKANPLRATPALVAAAERAGATLERRRAVQSITRARRHFEVGTSQGPIKAARIVNTGGAAAAEIAAMVGLDIPLDGFPLQVTVTEPVAPVLPHLVYSAAGKLSLKQTANGGCIIGGGWAARVRADGGLATDPRNFTGNMAVAAGVVPMIGAARAVRSWTAWVNGTRDWRPILGEAPDVPGFFLALFPWVGFSAGPITAQVTADLVMGRAPSLPLEGVSVLYD